MNNFYEKSVYDKISILDNKSFKIKKVLNEKKKK